MLKLEGGFGFLLWLSDLCNLLIWKSTDVHLLFWIHIEPIYLYKLVFGYTKKTRPSISSSFMAMASLFLVAYFARLLVYSTHSDAILIMKKCHNLPLVYIAMV